MPVASRTPEGEPHHCLVCGALIVIEPTEPLGDSICPRCGSLLSRLRDSLRARVLDLIRHGELESLDAVELVMELEEEFDVRLTDEEAEQIQTVGDAIRFILDRLH